MQDCLGSPSTADESRRFPKGIHIIGADAASVSRVEGLPRGERPADTLPTSEKPTSWSYLFLRHMAARSFRKWLDAYNADPATRKPRRYFIHQSYSYSYKDSDASRGVRRTLAPSVSGLVFLQGTVGELREFLATYFPAYHLVNDRSKGLPASIEHSVMEPFMKVADAHPEQVAFLSDPFEKFARDHVRLRVLTGLFKGCEGYIIRIRRDRRLVFDFGGLAVAVSGIHKETFQVVEE